MGRFHSVCDRLSEISIETQVAAKCVGSALSDPCLRSAATSFWVLDKYTNLRFKVHTKTLGNYSVWYCHFTGFSNGKRFSFLQTKTSIHGVALSDTVNYQPRQFPRSLGFVPYARLAKRAS